MKKYILFWGDGDGCTYHDYHSQPIETNDIDEWAYFLELIIENMEDGQWEITYKGLTLPAGSDEFTYEIIPFNEWWQNSINNQIF